MVSDPTCRALVCRDAGCLSVVGTYLLDTVLQGCRLFKRCQTYLPGTVLQGCRLLKWCRNLTAWHCVAGVQADLMVSEPTCQPLCCRCAGCSSGFGPRGQCWEGGAGCLSGVGTYLPCIVGQGFRLFKQYQNLPAWH